jgi:hypothetical protein
VANALEDGVSAESAGQLPDALDCGVPSLADDISRPELASQGNAVRVTAEHDDLLRTETTGGDDAAETHRAITPAPPLCPVHIRPQARSDDAVAITSESVRATWHGACGQGPPGSVY